MTQLDESAGTGTGTPPAGPGPTPAKRRTKGVLVALGAIVVVVAVAAAAFAFLSGGGTHRVLGTFSIQDSDSTDQPVIAWDGTWCKGVGDYADIQEGTPATMTDETGKVLDTGTLSAGVGGQKMCSFTFELKRVPDDAKTYALKVGDHAAGTRSHDQMVATDWKYTVTVGK
jgi:hypothetical protein